jgi:hypothetical protein
MFHKVVHEVSETVHLERPYGTTRNPLIYDEIHMMFLNFVIDHTASMTNSQISSQIGSAGYEARYEVQTL